MKLRNNCVEVVRDVSMISDGGWVEGLGKNRQNVCVGGQVFKMR